MKTDELDIENNFYTKDLDASLLLFSKIRTRHG